MCAWAGTQPHAKRALRALRAGPGEVRVCGAVCAHLAHAGLSEDDRVVLGATGQNVDHPAHAQHRGVRAGRGSACVRAAQGCEGRT